MHWLALAIVLTLAISFVCSLFEAVILSTTVAEIEALKKLRPRRGRLLETMKTEIDETISAILSLNTVANGIGSVTIGALSAHLFSHEGIVAVTILFGAFLLVASEVLPKNLGVAFRRPIQPHIVEPLWTLRRVLTPLTWLCNLAVRPFVRGPAHLHRSDEEIVLLAERGAQQGTLTASESNIIANALSLDEVRVSAIMTPRIVVAALRRDATVADVLKEYANLPFGRLPVYGKNIDDIVGLVRRRDLLKAKANDQDSALVEQLMHEVNFIPETVTVGNALQVFLKAHQQLLVVVDEFGAVAGVVTMEDVIEHLLGLEIFEKDDVAVDMRELARAKLQQAARSRRGPEGAMPLAYWVDRLSPFLGPHWGNFGIRYYGLAYMLGFLAAAWLFYRYARAGRSLLAEGKIADFMVAIVLGTLIGGRLGYFLLYRFDTLSSDPIAIFRVWEGGMASHGGFVGVTLALAWFARKEKIPFLHIGDLVVSAASAGLLFGRIANFVNGELWGKVTTVSWAVVFPESAPPGTPTSLIPPRHPSQLYEALLEGALLLSFIQWRFWKSDIVRTQRGRLSGEYLVAYACLRAVGETFREPDASLILGLSRGTFYSIFLVLVGAALIGFARKNRRG